MAVYPPKKPQSGSEEYHGFILPYLVGSERTIKWAKSIRKRRMMEFEAYSFEKDVTFINYVLSHRYAEWWLNTNHLPIEDFIQKVEMERQGVKDTLKS